MNETKEQETIETSTGLKYVVTQTGEGEKAGNSKTVTVHYTGSLSNGQVFDSSVQRNQPLKFITGVGQVIKGWDEALSDMRKGEKRTLTIPPDLGYGANGRPPTIPPNSVLLFDVELLDFQ